MIINIKDLTITTKIYSEIINLYNNFTLINQELLTICKLKKIIQNLPNNHYIYFYILNNQIVAGITLIIEQKLIHDGKCCGHIEDFVVLPEYRKQGLGKLLINYAINISKINNCYKCILDCDEYLINYYMKKGFIKKGIYMGKYFN